MAATPGARHQDVHETAFTSFPARFRSRQQVFQLPTHPLELLLGHVRVKRESQSLSARSDGALHPIARAARESLKDGLAMQGGVEVSLCLDPPRLQDRGYLVTLHP